MKLAYVDTSYLLAITFGEPGSSRLARRLAQFDVLLSSNLLEAEFKSALSREGVEVETGDFLSAIGWTLPDRPLTQEIDHVLRQGHIRGADLWHLACALYVAANPEEISFLTRDHRQQELAAVLGFRT